MCLCTCALWLPAALPPPENPLFPAFAVPYPRPSGGPRAPGGRNDNG